MSIRGWLTLDSLLARPDVPINGGELATLYLSVTSFCNLKCDYCSADAGPNKTEYLNEKIALQSVEQWLEDVKLADVRLIFTGGEAVFWGYDRLDAVCKHARSIASEKGINLHIGIQSNGTSVTSDFIQFCLRWNVEPSLSLDGSPNLSDSHRGLGQRVYKNFKKLQCSGIHFAIIICLTSDVAENIESVLDFMESNGFLKVRVNALGVPPERRYLDHISAKDIFNVKRALYLRYASGDPLSIKEYNIARQVKWFDQAVSGVELTKGHCESSVCQAGQKVAVINPDGQWGMCVEKSMTDGLPVFGSKSSLVEGASIFWGSHNDWNGCSSCQAQSICDFGCIAYHKGEKGLYDKECRANRFFWRFLVHVRLFERSVDEFTLKHDDYSRKIVIDIACATTKL